MKIIKPCDEVCESCGFLNDSQAGVLKESMGLLDIIEAGVVFPCHLQLKAVTGSENTGVHEYAENKDTFKVCRGYVESCLISGLHMDNPLWAKLYVDIMDSGNCPNPKLMTIEETIEYHKGN